MPTPQPFSAVSLIHDTVMGAAGALRERGTRCPLTEAETRQLTTLECLSGGLCIVAKESLNVAWVSSWQLEIAELFDCANRTTVNASSIAELLGMTGAVPKRWGRLPVTPEAQAWLGVTALIDDLALICATVGAQPARPRQCAILHDLQAGLGRCVELSRAGVTDADRRVVAAAGRVRNTFGQATNIIGSDVPAIQAEAEAIRARRQ